MKKLNCQRGQGSLLLILMIAGAIGVVASSLMLNMMNLQRASISLRIRSVTIRALEEISLEVKQAYDLASQTATDCSDIAPPAALTPAPTAITPKFCFRTASTYYYNNRFTLGRAAGLPIYTALVKNDYDPNELKFERMFARGLPFLREAVAAFNPAAYPYLPATLPSVTVNMNSNACTTLDEPCIACNVNADCYQFDVCMNGSATCAVPFLIKPIFGFMR